MHGGYMGRIVNAVRRTLWAAVTAAALMGLVACGIKSVVGTWSAQQGETTITYVFNEDGSGSMDIGSGITLPITYETDKDTLTLKYSMLGSEVSMEYGYVLSKKTLTLTDGDSSVTLEQQ
jgi:hypothetical protein